MATLKNGFTLVEVAIVLVVIGLLVGGVLSGRDLIAAGAIRSQLSQTSNVITAVHTFREKYGGLPGDLNKATQFGFVGRGQYAGEGDGNGLIEGFYNDAPASSGGVVQAQGETGVFWRDLTAARLIPGNFRTAGSNVYVNTVTKSTSPNLADYFPQGKLGDTYLYVLSNGGRHYLALSSAYQIAGWTLSSTTGISVKQAYDVDTKIDDGLPLTGKVRPRYIAFNVAINLFFYSQGNGVNGVSSNAATPASLTTCYDNNGVASATQKYSVGQNEGNGLNCALSFEW